MCAYQLVLPTDDEWGHGAGRQENWGNDAGQISGGCRPIPLADSGGNGTMVGAVEKKIVA